jgi:hypothetical protein
MTINDLLKIVPETRWDEPLSIEIAERRSVPVRSVKVDTSAINQVVFVPAPHFLCPRCDRISFNPTDLAERYCVACHVFFS